MDCEICGRKIHNNKSIISLERTTMQVCENCSRFGKIAPKRSIAQKPKSVIYTQRSNDNEVELVEDYFKLIQRARNQKKIKMKEFANMINERESVISRIERGQLEPTVQLAKKIERALGIKLFE